MRKPTQFETRRLDESLAQAVPTGNHDLRFDLGLPSKIALIVNSNEAKIVLHLVEPIIIGRSFPEDTTIAFLDLQMFRGDAHGVSRQHLRMWKETGAVYVEDLRSLNHTRLNQVVVEPNVAHRVHHGDQLALGDLKLEIEFIFDQLA